MLERWYCQELGSEKPRGREDGWVSRLEIRSWCSKPVSVWVSRGRVESGERAGIQVPTADQHRMQRGYKQTSKIHITPKIKAPVP